MTPIPAERLHEFWPNMKIGLEAMAARFKADWIPEDIYAALRNPATCTTAFAVADGFLVVQKQIQHCGPILVVWALYGPRQVEPQRQELQAEIDALGRALGAKKLRMQSPRKGWSRWGWKPIHTVYERDL